MRAQSGKRTLATVSRELTVEFGQAFTLRSLYRADQLCQGFTDQEIVSALSTQLSWSPAALQPGRNTYDITSKTIISLAQDVQDLQQQAARQYQPVVDTILHTCSSDIPHIENTLDGLLDFCGHEPVLEMYKQLCPHYWNIDPVATAYYINAYRDWDGDAQEGQP